MEYIQTGLSLNGSEICKAAGISRKSWYALSSGKKDALSASDEGKLAKMLFMERADCFGSALEQAVLYGNTAVLDEAIAIRLSYVNSLPRNQRTFCVFSEALSRSNIESKHFLDEETKHHAFQVAYYKSSNFMIDYISSTAGSERLRIDGIDRHSDNLHFAYVARCLGDMKCKGMILPFLRGDDRSEALAEYVQRRTRKIEGLPVVAMRDDQFYDFLAKLSAT